MDDLIQNLLKMTIAFGGCGAAIDFLLGKNGQKKVRDWLELQWYRFSEIKWDNFEEKEASMSIRIIDRIFGKRLLTLKRIISCYTLVFLIFIAITVIMIVSEVTAYADLWKFDYYVYGVLMLSTDSIVFAASISLTRQISAFCEASCRRYKQHNAILFGALLFIHYGLLVIWGPVVRTVTEVPWSWGFEWVPTYLDNAAKALLYEKLYMPRNFVREVWVNYREHSLEPLGVYNVSRDVINYLANFWRIMVAMTFATTFVFSRVLKPVSFVWARMIETEKPIFTLAFGGLAGAASLAQAIWRHI